MLTLTDLLVGLEERFTDNGHDFRIEAFNRDDSATLACHNCDLTVVVMIVNDFGGWRIEPDMTTLDTECAA